MSKKSFKSIIGAAALMAAVMPFSAYASEKISNVEISVLPDKDDPDPGVLYAGMEPVVESGDVKLDSYSTSTDDYKANTSYTYTIVLDAEDDYSFDSNTKVKVNGAYEASISKRSSDSLTVKAKAYPFLRLADPEGFDEDGNYAKWKDVEGSDKYYVYIYYENDNGDEKSASKNVSNNRIDLSSYYENYDNVRYSVKAAVTSGKGSKYMLDSRAIFNDGGVDEDKTKDLSFKDIYASTSGNSSSSSDSSSSSSSKSSKSSSAYSGTPGYSGKTEGSDKGSAANGSAPTGGDGWAGSGNDWSYYRNGEMVKSGWVEDNGAWYLMDENGKMKSGWYVDPSDEQTYCLNPNHDGTFGRLLSGWQQFGDRWYYFNEQHDGSFGKLFRNTTTPDGYYVGEDGVWVQKQ